MAITAALTKVCQEWSAGIKRVYLSDKANVTSMTLVGDVYTAITMAGASVFYEFEFMDDTASRMEEATRNEASGATVINRSIEFYIQGLSAGHRVQFQNIVNSSTCGIIIISEDNQNYKIVDGYNEKSKRAMKASSVKLEVGKKFEDLIGGTVILTNSSNEFSRYTTATVPV